MRMLVPGLYSWGWARKVTTSRTTVTRWHMRAKLHVREMWCKLKEPLCMFLSLSSWKLLKLSSSYSPATRNLGARGGG